MNVINNIRVRNGIRMVVFLASVICALTMVALISSNNRQYKFCPVGFYELNYWWQVGVLCIAMCYLVATICRCSRHVRKIILALASAGSLAFCGTLMAKSGNILVYTISKVVGNADAPFGFIFMMMVLAVMAFMPLAAVGFLGARQPIRF